MIVSAMFFISSILEVIIGVVDEEDGARPESNLHGGFVSILICIGDL